MKIDEGVNGKIHAKLRQMLNSKAILALRCQIGVRIWKGDLVVKCRVGFRILSSILVFIQHKVILL